MATKGTAWVVRRSTDLVPGLLAMAVREWLGRQAERPWAGQDAIMAPSWNPIGPIAPVGPPGLVDAAGLADPPGLADAAGLTDQVGLVDAAGLADPQGLVDAAGLADQVGLVDPAGGAAGPA
jgi:hypothetical protein